MSSDDSLVASACAGTTSTSKSLINRSPIDRFPCGIRCWKDERFVRQTYGESASSNGCSLVDGTCCCVYSSPTTAATTSGYLIASAASVWSAPSAHIPSTTVKRVPQSSHVFSISAAEGSPSSAGIRL
jgi:hypothetical protein